MRWTCWTYPSVVDTMLSKEHLPECLTNLEATTVQKSDKKKKLSRHTWLPAWPACRINWKISQGLVIKVKKYHAKTYLNIDNLTRKHISSDRRSSKRKATQMAGGENIKRHIHAFRRFWFLGASIQFRRWSIRSLVIMIIPFTCQFKWLNFP